jgi:hypothetical protein
MGGMSAMDAGPAHGDGASGEASKTFGPVGAETVAPDFGCGHVPVDIGTDRRGRRLAVSPRKTRRLRPLRPRPTPVSGRRRV